MAATDILSLDSKSGSERPKAPKAVTCPFSIIIDSREQLPFRFEGFTANVAEGGGPLIVPTQRAALEVGDYSIFSLPMIVVERKSKEDLYSSVGQRRDNFEARLNRMCSHYYFSAVVIESDWTDIFKNPPHFTRFSPKALARTIWSWQIRYPRVHWMPWPNREAAEAYTFRLLERFWHDWHDGKTYNQSDEFVSRMEEAARTVRPGEALP
jgi:ERCC4-type nuclease